MASRLRGLFTTRFSADPATQQRRIVEEFLAILPSTRLKRWAIGDLIPGGRFVLVGLAVGWNRYEMALAIALDEAIADGRTVEDSIAVLSADHLITPEQLDEVFPGLSETAVQSPFLGVWDDGELFFVDSGASATSFLSDRYGLTLP